MSRIIVELRGVTKIYPGAVPVKALDNVNMKIEAGEFVAIMGSSGSGKTTLLNMIGCMDRPTSGEVIIDGVNTRNPSE
ncbi:MAG TPA: ATP-binding cassette domain-containing protein, partial [Candidatus Bathyarchaeota archaeon]|nr:ATP-binding cassette domain-containing protein [Candidatus Bathyarchaeota archaeon]